MVDQKELQELVMGCIARIAELKQADQDVIDQVNRLISVVERLQSLVEKVIAINNGEMQSKNAKQLNQIPNLRLVN